MLADWLAAGLRAAAAACCRCLGSLSIALYLDISGCNAEIKDMDISVILLAVLLGNFITAAFVWNLRQIAAPVPPLSNLAALLFIFAVIAVIAYAAHQSLSAVP